MMDFNEAPVDICVDFVKVGWLAPSAPSALLIVVRLFRPYRVRLADNRIPVSLHGPCKRPSLAARYTGLQCFVAHEMPALVGWRTPAQCFSGTRAQTSWNWRMSPIVVRKSDLWLMTFLVTVLGHHWPHDWLINT